MIIIMDCRCRLLLSSGISRQFGENLKKKKKKHRQHTQIHHGRIEAIHFIYNFKLK